MEKHMKAFKSEKQGSEAATSQFLAFQLGAETYGVPLLEVQEIRTYTLATPIPNTPAHVLGVINLRGAIIAVIDLRRRLGLPSISDDEQTIFMVVTIGDKTYGLRADSVSDVIEINTDSIQEAPKVMDEEKQRFISGLAQITDRVIVLLNLEEVIDIETVSKMAA
jgi:purine-binding chemotaxis protein CheW